MYNINELTTFDESKYGCVLVKGYAATERKNKRYLGKHRSHTEERNSITCTILANSPDKQNAFANWYRDELNGGVDPFIIVLPYFGLKWKMVVVFDEGITDTYAGDGEGAIGAKFIIMELIRVAEELTFSMPLSDDMLVERGLPSAFEYKRNSRGSFTRGGLLMAANKDEGRFGDTGLLMEDESTNLFLHSNNFEDAAWGKVNGAVVKKINIVSPTGVEGDVHKIEQSATDINSSFVAQSFTNAVDNQYYTVSLFIKKGNSDKMKFFVGCEGGTTGIGSLTTYDFTNDTITVGAPDKVKVILHEQLANGWIHLGVMVKNNSTGNTKVSLRIHAYGLGGTPQGNEYVYVYGAQLEAKAIASSYIETVANPVTRHEDSFVFYDSKAGIDWTKPITFAMSFNVDIPKFDSDVQVHRILLFSKGLIKVIITYNKQLRVYVNDTLAVTRILDTYKGVVRMILRSDGTKMDLFVNGVNVGYFNAPKSVGGMYVGVTFMGGSKNEVAGTQISSIKISTVYVDDVGSY